AFVPDGLLTFQGDIDGELFVTGNINEPKVNGNVILDSVSVFSDQWGVQLHFDNRPLAVTNNQLKFDKFSIYTTEKNPFTIDGNLDFVDVSSPKLDVHLKAKDYVLLDAKRTKESLAYGKVIVDVNTTVKGPLDALVLRGGMSLNGKTDVSYVLKDSPLTVQDRLGDLVTFTSFSDTLHVEQEDSVFRTLGGMDLLLSVNIDPAVRLKVDLSEDRSSRVSLEGGGNLILQYTPQGDLALSGRYTLTGGLIRYSLPVIPLKDFNITEGSYVEWTGDVTNPKLDIKATERLRAAVADENNQSRRVNFDLSVLIKNRVNNLDLKFDIEAPEDSEVQKQLLAMSEDERIKQAVVMMATGRFMASDGGSTGSGLDMGTALNSVLQSQINAIAGKMDNVSFSVGVDEYDETSTGGRHTDYSFSYSQRFFNNRVQIVIGGKVSTGENVTNDMESFIDNISVEYRLDNTGTRYVRLFHNKNYDNILEGEVIETGVGLILRRKVDRLSELFIFKRKKKESHEDKL
ncbi:MAG: translocation/assembly module TamB domain-containing protein, partial [Bacteroidaceae bacterium]